MCNKKIDFAVRVDNEIISFFASFTKNNEKITFVTLTNFWDISCKILTETRKFSKNWPLFLVLLPYFPVLRISSLSFRNSIKMIPLYTVWSLENVKTFRRDFRPLRFFKNFLEFQNGSKFARRPNSTYSTIRFKNFWGQKKSRFSYFKALTNWISQIIFMKNKIPFMLSSSTINVFSLTESKLWYLDKCWKWHIYPSLC